MMFRIIGIGDNVVDRYLYKNTMYPGGNAVNVPVLAARTGLAVGAYIGCLGNDAAGVHVLSALRAEGIEVSRVRVLEGSNAYANVDLIDGDRTFIGGDSGVSKRIVLEEEDVELLADYDLIHTSCYSGLDDILPKIHSVGPTVCYDYSDKLNFDFAGKTLPYVDIALFSGGNLPEEELRQLALGAIARGPSQVMITMGARGSMLYRNGCFYRQSIHRIGAVKDTMAAGDSFIARYLCGFYTGEGIEKSLENAAVFAAQNCMVDGSFGYPAAIE